jgi:hypothetical protein
MSEQANKALDTGTFLPGHQWRYRKGQSGRVIKFSYKSMRKLIIEYTDQQDQAELNYTWAGLAKYLGITRPALDLYRHNKNKTADPEIATMLSYYKTGIESQLEQGLSRTTGQVSGIMFALKNQYSDAWKDEKHINVEATVTNQISLAITPESPLGQSLIDSGAVLAGECTVESEDS